MTTAAPGPVATPQHQLPPSAPWPYQYPVAPPPQPQGKTFFGLSPLTAIILLLIVGVIAFFLIAILLGGLSGGGEDLAQSYDEDIVIGDGGHFRLELGAGWTSRRVEVNITSTGGGRFDVYLMDEDQYELVYGNESTNAFSAVRRFENVSALMTNLTLPDTGISYVLVIDNTDNPLLATDAVPTGTVTLELHVRVYERVDY
jgi:hypothetical protein